MTAVVVTSEPDAKLYGVCWQCHSPRAVRSTLNNGRTTVELVCPKGHPLQEAD